jgi:iron complex outermembrane receptor protein
MTLQINRVAALLLATSALALATPVLGQTAPAPPAPPQPTSGQADTQDTGGLDDIIVTAQKRSENLQKVPISVATVSGELVDKLHATSLDGLQTVFPGVQMGRFANQPASAVFNIRGIGVIEPDAYAGNTVSIVLDGVPQFYNYGALLELYDIDRVEVLKGPQGTLFGANTTGGVVNITTAQPTGKYGGKAEITFGNFNRIDIGATVNLPLSDSLSAKFVAFHTQNDGWVRNVADPDQKLGRRDRSILRAYLKYAPNTNFDATLIGEYSRMRDGGSYNVTGGSPVADLNVPPGIAPVTGAELLSEVFVPHGYAPICGSDTQTPCKAPKEFVAGRDPNFPDLNNLDSYRGTLTMNLRNTPIGDITAVTGYKSYNWREYLDFDGTGSNLFRGLNKSYGWQFSQELRTSANLTDKFNIIAGVFYLQTDYSTARGGQSYLNGLTPGALEQTAHRQKEYSISGFAQAYWDITPKLQLLAGIRYSYENKNLVAKIVHSFAADGDPDMNAPFEGPGKGFDTQVPAGNIITDSTFAGGEKSWNNVGWKLGLNYKPADDVLLYASWSRGFKSGGFTGRIGRPQDVGPYQPEKVDSYEAGFKADWLGHRLRTNLSVFLVDYSNIQLSTAYILLISGSYVSGSTIINAASARNKGAEFEIMAEPIDGLTFGASVAYLDAKYKKFLLAVPDIDPFTAGFQPGVQNLSGRTLMNAPKWSYNINATYEFALGSGKATARAQYAYTGVKFQNPELFERSEIQATGLIDANLDWAPTNGNWSIGLWAKNIANKHYFSSAFAGQGLGVLASYANPREFGATVRFNW